MVFYLLGRLVCHAIGYVYPVYASYKVLKSQHSTAELTHWLTYWMVMGLFVPLEFVADTFIFWLPFYNIFKVLLVAWLVLPQTKGANYVYDVLIKPWLVQNEEEIDRYLSRAHSEMETKSNYWGQRGFETFHQVAMDSLVKGQAYITKNTPASSPGQNFATSHPLESQSGLRYRPGPSADDESTASTVPHGTRLSLQGLSSLVNTYMNEGLSRLSSSPMALAHSLNALVANRANLDPELAANRELFINTQRQKLHAMLSQLDEAEAQLRGDSTASSDSNRDDQNAGLADHTAHSSQGSMTRLTQDEGLDSADDMVFLSASTVQLMRDDTEIQSQSSVGTPSSDKAKPGWLW
ncbi:hypothetical protein H4R34_005043 [Dimargaris verticillata]|uniref:Protein YOP1 n=1 Tax=Dimargaris verticillata TaxID=2761393 RepID=A0A9W8AYY7_9FUNG|nr:hypothetical protein H4R34_005043 [Dimargaris verticillata]